MSGSRRCGRGHGMAAEDAASVNATGGRVSTDSGREGMSLCTRRSEGEADEATRSAKNVSSADVAAWGGEGEVGPPLWTRPQEDRGCACVDVAARDGRIRCRCGRGRAEDCGGCRRGRGFGGDGRGFGNRCSGRGHGTATVDVASVDAAAWDGHGHVVADEDVGGGGAEACHYGRGHMAVVEDAAFVQVAAQTATSDFAADRAVGRGGGRRPSPLQTRPWVDRRVHRLWRRGCAGRPWEISHQTDEAAGWLRCYRCEQRCACKLLQGSFRSAVTWPRSLFVSKLQTLGSIQLRPEYAKCHDAMTLKCR